MGLISDGRWEKDVWEGSPLPKAPRAKPVAAGDLRGAFDGLGRVDEIDVIFLGAWLAAPVELRGSRPELGAIDDDDEVRQTQMTPGVRGDENWVCGGVKGFLEWPYSCHLEGGKPVKFRGPGDGCGEAGVGKGMEALTRGGHTLAAGVPHRSGTGRR